MANFTQVEGDNPAQLYIRCGCGQVIKQRKDSFMPGLHQVICLVCGDRGSEIELMTGETVQVTDADHRDLAG